MYISGLHSVLDKEHSIDGQGGDHKAVLHRNPSGHPELLKRIDSATSGWPNFNLNRETLTPNALSRRDEPPILSRSLEQSPFVLGPLSKDNKSGDSRASKCLPPIRNQSEDVLLTLAARALQPRSVKYDHRSSEISIYRNEALRYAPTPSS